MPARPRRRACLLASAFALCAVPLAAHAQDADNGTNPTRLSRQVQATYEYTDLRGGFESSLLRLNYTHAFGADQDYSLRFRVPVASSNVFGSEAYRLGDASVQLTHVFGVTRARGLVLQGEMSFDTADRPELGTGQNVFKGTFIYALFRKSGDIFAPALVHSESLWGDDDRADVQVTTVDLYYVPKLANPRNLITYDPFITHDWETDADYGGLAVTFGRVVGPMLGGNGIVTVKPTYYLGADRPGTWGVELGFKVIGF
jgi:hypothetical protein